MGGVLNELQIDAGTQHVRIGSDSRCHMHWPVRHGLGSRNQRAHILYICTYMMIDEYITYPIWIQPVAGR